MKTKFFSILVLIILASFSNIFAQGFTPPSDGKAVVYFTRLNSIGAAVSFEYFQNDKYIGIFKGKNYMRYECEPGEQLLWASTENKEFVSAELEAGKTYIVVVKAVMGAMKARVKLQPITENDKEDFDDAKKLILSEAPVEMSESDIEKKNEKLKDFITDKLERYENDWKGTDIDHKLSADMAISEEAMK